MYMRPFTTSRMITVRLPPPVLPGGISGSTSPHSSSVRSLVYRNLLRSYRARFLLVHISGPSSNQATTVESQVIHMIQVLFGQTLRYSIQHTDSDARVISCPRFAAACPRLVPPFASIPVRRARGITADCEPAALSDFRCHHRFPRSGADERPHAPACGGPEPPAAQLQEIQVFAKSSPHAIALVRFRNMEHFVAAASGGTIHS